MQVDEVLPICAFSEEKVFYVYTHTRLDTGCVFYVGKGKAKRAFSKGSRNQHWINVTTLTDYNVDIIKENLTEKEAFDLEQELISEIGLENLCNQTLGGVSTTGYKHTEDTKQLFSEIAKNRLKTNPEYKEQLLNRINSLVANQDENFRKIAISKARAKYQSLSAEEKAIVDKKKLRWLQDPEKVQKAKLKIAAKRQEISLKISSTLRSKPRIKIQRDPEFMRYFQSKGSESLRKPVVINRKLKLHSKLQLVELYGKDAWSALSRATRKGLPCVIFNGYFIENYDPILHINVNEDVSVFPTDKLNPVGKLFVMDDLHLMTTKQICELLNKPQNCIDWITKIIRTDQTKGTAFGHKWRTATKEDVKKYLSEQLEELSKND